MSLEGFIDLFNRSWINEDADQLKSLLHEDVVFMKPGGQDQICGRADCLASFEEYWSMGKTINFSLKSLKQFRWSAFINVILNYEVAYQINGTTYHEKCQEVWSIVQEEQEFLMVWRALIENEVLE